MARWVRVPAALAEDLGVILNIHWLLPTACNSSSRSYDALFWYPEHQANMQYTGIHTYKIVILIK